MEKAEIRAAIEELLAAYVHCIDDDRLEEWPEFFTEQCLYRIIPRENADYGLPIALMHCDSRGMLRDRVVAHRAANLYAPHYYRHQLSALHITSNDKDMITTQTNYVVFRTMADPINYGTTEIYSAGKYVDKIVWINEKPWFQEKIVVVDTARIQSLLVTPL